MEATGSSEKFKPIYQTTGLLHWGWKKYAFPKLLYLFIKRHDFCPDDGGIRFLRNIATYLQTFEFSRWSGGKKILWNVSNYLPKLRASALMMQIARTPETSVPLPTLTPMHRPRGRININSYHFLLWHYLYRCGWNRYAVSIVIEWDRYIAEITWLKQHFRKQRSPVFIGRSVCGRVWDSRG
jgi:hypothetical protein